ncbi:MAG: branched-chain amino acid ABC transporter permease [Clostridia bacterium]|nr:branched-chain amino acid ABC transporter permease [Clostridia bacterium]
MAEKRLKLKKNTKNNTITYALVLAVFLLIEIMQGTGNISSLLSGLLVPLCMYSILAVSLNLTVGILGELSLGHAGFMCIGAYASSIFSVVTQNTITNVWIRFPIAILIGGLFAAVFGILIGIPILRLKGDYLAIVTLAFGEIIKNVLGSIYVGYDSHGVHMTFESASSLDMEPDGTLLINGPLGISGTPNDSNFIVGIVLLAITLIVVLNFINSRAGRAVMSLRDNRIAAESVGINVTKYKLMAFTISAFFAGIAGVLYSHNLSILAATSKNFGYNMSIMILVFVVLGGIGSIRGSMIAACVLTIIPEKLRELQDYRMLIYAIVLIVMMLLTSSPKMVKFWEAHSPKRFIEDKFRSKKSKAKGVQ